MRNDRPCGAQQRVIGRRVSIDQFPRRFYGETEIFHFIKVVGGSAKNNRRFFMIRVCVCELQRARHRLTLDLTLARTGHIVQFLAVGEDSRVSGSGCLLMLRVLVAGLLVFFRRNEEVLVFQ